MMLALYGQMVGFVVDLFRSRTSLQAEILVLRQQITVLRRSRPSRLRFMPAERLVLGWVCRLFPNACGALAIVQPRRIDPEFADLVERHSLVPSEPT